MEERYSNDLSLQQVMVEHRRTNRNPSIRYVSDSVIREGTRSSKVATIFQIVNHRTGELHHYALKLETLTKRKATGWEFSKHNSITLGESQDGSNEIGKLMTFIATVTQGLLPDEDGGFVVMNSRNQAVRELLKHIPSIDTSRKLEMAINVLSELGRESVTSEELETALENTEFGLLRSIALVSRLVEYRRAYRDFVELVSNPDTKEANLQRCLEEHPWMFGSEYSELLSKKVWTRDDRQDFMLRRTVDGYLEIIEIKRPTQSQLFNIDSSHDSFYPSSLLSLAVGQVMRYIEEIERQRDHILAQDGQDPLKIRARIIVGRDGDEGQQAALRNFNAHLNRIEVLTYDQLLRIANRVLAVFEEQQKAISQDYDIDDLPF